MEGVWENAGGSSLLDGGGNTGRILCLVGDLRREGSESLGRGAGGGSSVLVGGNTGAESSVKDK